MRHRRSAIAAASLLLIAAATTVDPLRTFLSSLSPTMRQKALMRFSDEERFDWHYVPRSRGGLPLGDLNQDQTSLLHAFLRANLGPAGYRKAAGVIELEPILGRLEGSRFRDPARYSFSLFGDPAALPWGWRFEGHHLSLNVTHTPRGTSYTPMFIGANPARVPSGARAGWQLLRDEEHHARAFLQSLDTGQRAQAVISARAPADIVTGTDRSFRLQRFEGLAASAMTGRQRQALLELVAVYVRNAPQPAADAELAKIRRAGIENLHFAWAGSAQPGQRHYYRIHGPTVLIEYDNTDGSGNHIHTVWRNPQGDFGDDVLARHYAEAPHHAAAFPGAKTPTSTRSFIGCSSRVVGKQLPPSLLRQRKRGVAMATTYNFALQLLFNKDVPDYFGTWEYAAATGVDQALQLTVQLIATKRTHTFGGSSFPASMLTATVMFPAAAGAVPPNLTLQGVHDFATNNESGSVSAASAELADQIGGTFTFIGGVLTILPPGVSAASGAEVA